jgi:hypothetical protein
VSAFDWPRRFRQTIDVVYRAEVEFTRGERSRGSVSVAAERTAEEAWGTVPSTLERLRSEGLTPTRVGVFRYTTESYATLIGERPVDSFDRADETMTAGAFLTRAKRGTIFPAGALAEALATMPRKLREERRTWAQWLEEFDPEGREGLPKLDPGPLP